MSKLYTNKKAGTSILTGKIKAISEDRKSIEVMYNEYVYEEKKNLEKSKTLSCQTPVDETYKVGKTVTAVGYVTGPVLFQVASISNKENVYEMQEIGFISGHVTSVRINEEKDENGAQKMTQAGTPKKPHFDIQVVVPREDGQLVHHFVKVYDQPLFQKEGEATNIEKYSKRFVDFKDAESTPMYVTIATNPGTEYAFTRDDGSIYLGSDHLGIRSLDIQYEFSKQRENTQQTSVQQPSPRQSAPAPVQVVVAEAVNGFDVDEEIIYEDEFENI